VTATSFAPAEPIERSHERTTGWWGMILVIFTEGTLFAVLLLSYAYLRFSATPAWPPPGIEAPTLKLPVVMTIVLVSSSLPMQLAVHASRAGRAGRARLLLGIGILMGAAFLVMQIIEYHTKLAKFRPTTNSYGSLFFTITGFHGIHVIVGLLISLWALLLGCRRLSGAGHRTVENAVLYWHFVDLVWVAVFSIIYLMGAL
jgi:heme/copper-type cytochrome/quinol oxidase subunit 3